jgi:DNA polymerase-1
MKHLSETDFYLYNAGDVVDTLSAWEGILKEFHNDERSEGVYRTQSLQAVPVVLRSQSRGIRVGKVHVHQISDKLQRDLVWARATAQVYSGYPINIASDDQLKYELFVREGFAPQFAKKTKKWTIDGDAIAALRASVGNYFDLDEELKSGLSIEDAIQHIEEGGHPLLEARVVFASAQQQLSHYINPLIKFDKTGGIMHIKERAYPHFLIHAQASGRWSTVDPPMAQIPKALQALFIPDEGQTWVEWDWDQIELRILAALSRDEIYEEAFLKGWDVHTLNTCDIFGWPYPSNKENPHSFQDDQAWRDRYAWIGKDDPRRRFAKVFIFRLNYGGEARTATDIPGVKQMGLKAKDLVEASASYLRRHPRIRQYWDSITRDGIARREIRTFMGRRRRLLVEGKNAMKRLIYNHPMQGGVSDIFNTVLIRVAQACPEAIFVYGVHDAQKWTVPTDRYAELKARMMKIVHTPWTIAGRSVVFPATFKP